jgi:hypothetical protein
MKLTLTRREARLAVFDALHKKYPDVGYIGHRSVEIEVIEVDNPDDIAVEATLVTEKEHHAQ